MEQNHTCVHVQVHVSLVYQTYFNPVSTLTSKLIVACQMAAVPDL